MTQHNAPVGSLQRLLIIGLDGATFGILDPLFERGLLPNLQRLCREGIRTELQSTRPAATLPAWTSLLTASYPSQHGVADMLVHRGKTYDLQAAGGRLRSLPTVLARLSDMGRQVVSLGVPGTFPPEPISGLCVSGFDAPSAHRADERCVWPPEAHRLLRRLGGWKYASFNEQSTHANRHRRALEAILADLEAKEHVALQLQATVPWQLFFLHVQASDTVAHHFWHTFDPQSPRAARMGTAAAMTDADGDLAPLREAIPRVYARIDALVGRLLDAAPPGCRVAVVSDHGFGGASTTAVHLNRWLHDAGLLKFQPPRQRRLKGGLKRLLMGGVATLAPSLLDGAVGALPSGIASRLMGWARGDVIDYGQSAAFSDELDYAPSIWINRKDRFKRGTVPNARAAETLVQRLQEELLALSDPKTGQHLIQAVYTRAQLPAGPHANRLPDLVIEPAWPGGYRPSFLRSLGPGPAVRRIHDDELDAPRGSGMPGVHHPHGVFVAWGPGLPAMQMPVLHIAEAGALLYPLLGLPIPHDVPAEPASYWSRAIPWEREEPRAAQPIPQAQVDSQRTARVTQRLRALGYLD